MTQVPHRTLLTGLLVTRSSDSGSLDEERMLQRDGHFKAQRSPQIQSSEELLYFGLSLAALAITFHAPSKKKKKNYDKA